MSAPLSTDLTDPEAVPYFQWDAPMTVREFEEKLRTAPQAEQDLLLARMLREARDTDVWRFTTPEEVARRWDRLAPHLARRREFWSFLLDAWREQGLLDV
jgi:hypothetical protein